MLPPPHSTRFLTLSLPHAAPLLTLASSLTLPLPPQLYLQDNRLSTLAENMLPWLDLTLVDLQNNPWNCDCHLKWVAETLIPDLEKKNPQTTLSLM